MKIVDEGILLRKINHSETSLITTIYTQKHGTQIFYFQGGKKKASVLFPLSHLELVYYHRADSEMNKLTQAVTIQASEIPFHPIKATVAYFIADVLFQSLKTNQADEFLFQFIVKQITAINQQENLSVFPLTFLIQLSMFLGIEPQIEDEDAQFFDLQEGEIKQQKSNSTTMQHGKHIQLIASLYLQNKSEYNFSHQREAFQVMLKYYEIHVPGFNVNKSLQILKDILH